MWITRLSVLGLLLAAIPASAHEFWIEPEQYQVQSGDELVAHLRNGEEFKGVSLAFFEKRFTRFEIHVNNKAIPVQGRMGDTPAVQTDIAGDGLLIIIHETTPSTLTYREWEKFLRFAKHKDFPQAASDHEARGWDKEVFRESYTRHVKSLMNIGTPSGADRAYGLKTEFVALTNPYLPDFDNEMRVQVNLDGAPRPDAQVEVFERAGKGEPVTVSLYRTDDQGQVTIPVKDGHEYLFDAVVLAPSDLAGTDERAPVWETYWAGLTFAVP